MDGKASIGPYATEINNLNIKLPDSRIRIVRAAAEAGMSGIASDAPFISILTKSTYINPSDLGAVLTPLKAFDSRLAFGIDASGSADRLDIDLLHLSAPNNEFSLNTSGTLRNIRSGINAKPINVTINTSEEFYEWLTEITAESEVNIPRIADNFGNSRITVSGRGSLEDNSLNLEVNTDNIGSLIIRSTGNNRKFNVNIESGKIDLRRLTGNSSLGYAELNGNALLDIKDTKHYSGNAMFNVPQFQYASYTFNGISLTSAFDQNRYNISANINDQYASVSAEMQYTPEIEAFTAFLNADSVDLAATGLDSRDSTSVLSGNVTIITTGTTLNELRGRVTIDNLSYTNNDADIVLHSVEMMIRDVYNGETLTSLSSEFANATILGKYDLSTIPLSFARTVRDVLPSLYSKITKDWKFGAKAITDNRFDATLSVSKSDLIDKLFNIPLEFNETAMIQAHIDDSNAEDNILVNVPSLFIGDKGVSDASIQFLHKEDTLSVSLSGDISYGMNNITGIDGFIEGRNDRLNGLFTLESEYEDELDGDIRYSLTFGPYDSKDDNLEWQLGIDDTELSIGGENWHIDKSLFTSNSGKYDIDGLRISHTDQFVSVNGSVSADSTSLLNMSFSQIDLEQIMSLIGNNKNGISGLSSGEIYASSLLDKPILYGNIKADDLRLMDTRFGDVTVNGEWENQSEQVKINAIIDCGEDSISTAIGTFSPSNDSIDIRINARHLNLYFLNSLLPRTVFTELKGHTSTIRDIRIFGKAKQLDIDGTALLENGFFNVTANNCKYRTMSDTLRFEPGLMSFRNIKAYDDSGNSGRLDIVLNHNHLSNFNIDLGVESEGIKVYSIPKSETSAIYGNIFIGGTPHLQTRRRNTTISGTCKTTPGTVIYVNSVVSNADDYDFLIIRDATKANLQKKDDQQPAQHLRRSSARFNLDVNMQITDDAQIYADMNSLAGYTFGSGNLLLNYNKDNGITAYGNLDIDGGKCTMSLQKVLRKEFSIMDNSHIMFNGNLQSSTLDIHASHLVNSASLSDLDPTANPSSRVKALCLLDVIGTVASPQLSFGVDLQQASAEENEILAGATGTEEQRNMQFMYLLAVGKFYTYNYANNAGAMFETTTAMESILNSTVNGQINNLLAQVINSNNISFSSNVSTGYLSENATSFVDNTFEGILEARLLNNRLIMNGNFGYRQNALNNTSSFIGDIDVKYLLFPKLGISLLGYNRNNQRYFTKTTLNTQGIGVAYQNDFDHLWPVSSSQKNQ